MNGMLESLAGIFLAFGIPGAFVLYFLLRDRSRFPFSFKSSNKPLSSKEYHYLNTYFPYFRALSDKEQQEFALRVRDFMYEKEFVGEGLKITTDMRLLVAAYATQISFGLERTLFLHFNKVIIHSKVYRSRNGRMHKGEVNPISGDIHLSWPDLLQGLNDPTDGIDLGLHEMAHALWFEDEIYNAEMEFLPKEAKEQWEVAAAAYVHAMRAGKQSIFRRYGSVNTREFFAVAVEHFFERPTEFHEQEPELYAVLSALLHQDPAKQMP